MGDDNFNIDPNEDNWNDCGSDGDCDVIDENGTQNNGMWDDAEGTEGNGIWDEGEYYVDIYGVERDFEKVFSMDDMSEFLRFDEKIFVSDVICDIDVDKFHCTSIKSYAKILFAMQQ